MEYSAKDVKPPELLLRNLIQAHSTFLLHHASSISALMVRNFRTKFVNILGRYWDEFITTWTVTLHGNPAVAIYGGIKLASSGELGIGVGEEDRGSGEREVLEGFVGRVDGLIDLVVSRFGDAEELTTDKGKQPSHHMDTIAKSNWLGTGSEPSADDGAVFLGVGALSRDSLRDLTHWMEEVYSWGPRAYGVMDNPINTRQKHRKTKKRPENKWSNRSEQPMQQPELLSRPSEANTIRPSSKAAKQQKLRKGSKGDLMKDRALRPMSPLPTPQEPTLTQESANQQSQRPSYGRAQSSKSSDHSVKGTSRFSDYFKLGYGTHWSLTGSSYKDEHSSLHSVKSLKPPVEEFPPRPLVQHHPDFSDSPNGRDKPYYPLDDYVGHFLVGLLGDIEADEGQASSADESGGDGNNLRLVVRTVTVELERESDARAEGDISIDLSTGDGDVTSNMGSSQQTGTSHASSFEAQDRNKTKKLRVVLYCKRPFIYTLLFELRTESLAFPSLYRSLHHQLSPLQRPLLKSTSQRLARPLTSSHVADARNPIYDLVWDPKSLVIMSSIPNIPPHGHAYDNMPPWSRMEALSTHAQLLNTYIDTRFDEKELERTCKTSRAYWIVWTRIPDPELPNSPKQRLRSIGESSAATSRMSTPDIDGMSLGISEHNGSMNIPGSINLSEQALLSQRDGKRRGNSPKMKKKMNTRWSDRSRSLNTGSLNQSSLNSGPAHPFLEPLNPLKEHLKFDKEICLIRKAGVTGRGDEKQGLARGIGVDIKQYVDGLLKMMK